MLMLRAAWQDCKKERAVVRWFQDQGTDAFRIELHKCHAEDVLKEKSYKRKNVLSQKQL